MTGTAAFCTPGKLESTSRCGFFGIGPTNGPGEGNSGFCICGLVYSVFSPAVVKSGFLPPEFNLRRPNRKSIKKPNEARAETPTPAPIPAFAPVLRLLLGDAIGAAVDVVLAVTVTTLRLPDCDNTPPVTPVAMDDIEVAVIDVCVGLDDPTVDIVTTNVDVVDTRLTTELVYVFVLTVAWPLKNVEVDVTVVNIETHEYEVPVQVETGIALGARAYFSSCPLTTSSISLRAFTCGTVVVDVTV
jgi:hypothetical protein